MDLATLLNAPGDFEYEGTVYQLREPTLMESARFQRWLEGEALAGAAAATSLPEEDRRNLLRDVAADVASKRYAWGGEECVRSLRTTDGIAKLMSIVCESQDVTYPLAKRMVDARLTDIARLMLDAETGDDPEKKAQVRQLLKSVGLPANFLSASWSSSPTGTPDPVSSTPSAG